MLSPVMYLAVFINVSINMEQPPYSEWMSFSHNVFIFCTDVVLDSDKIRLPALMSQKTFIFLWLG